jgi:hypothetical protein
LNNQHITKLSGLERLENLKYASFNGNDITKIEVLMIIFVTNFSIHFDLPVGSRLKIRLQIMDLNGIGIRNAQNVNLSIELVSLKLHTIGICNLYDVMFTFLCPRHEMAGGI